MKNISEFNRAAMSLNGVQDSQIRDNNFEDNKTINKYLVVRAPIVKVNINALSNSERLIVTGDQKYLGENHWQLTPEFSDESYNLGEDSLLKRKRYLWFGLRNSCKLN